MIRDGRNFWGKQNEFSCKLCDHTRNTFVVFTSERQRLEWNWNNSRLVIDSRLTSTRCYSTCFHMFALRMRLRSIPAAHVSMISLECRFAESATIMNFKLICLPRTDEDLSQSHEIIDANSRIALLSCKGSECFCQRLVNLSAIKSANESRKCHRELYAESYSKQNDLQMSFSINMKRDDLMSSELFRRNKQTDEFVLLHSSFRIPV